MIMTSIALKGINENVRKFLMLITYTEGTDRDKTPYNELFGFTNFTGYNKHPNIKITASNYSSTAAGRYQILKGTADMLKMKDFTPESQDLAAIQLIKNAKAYDDVVAGKWEDAIKKTNKIWASLPGSPYGQPTVKLGVALKFLKSI
jgi:muramidase (phage lysozyme)